MVLTEPLVQKGIKEIQALTVQLAHKALPVPMEQMVPMELTVPMEQLAHKDHKVLLGRMASMAQ
jgi:hypothetical protein